MPDEFPYEVFLSHSAQDKPRVRRLAERLKQTGLQTETGLRLRFGSAKEPLLAQNYRP